MYTILTQYSLFDDNSVSFADYSFNNIKMLEIAKGHNSVKILRNMLKSWSGNVNFRYTKYHIKALAQIVDETSCRHD